ncbi:hypothetical protein GCM10023153_28810 [Ornithinibacter aureus]|uniref:Uncharacterized protein n=1 Tax=Ornithinibacter aureus TaxID=622664 RepID=A0ABP8K5W2_9MICO
MGQSLGRPPRGLWVTPRGGRRAAYSEGVPLGPDPALARAAADALFALRERVADAEDDVLSSLVVTGEPRPQRVLDDWLDQVADTLRAVGETASDLATTLRAHTDATAENTTPTARTTQTAAVDGWRP